ncbi:unnamed protein product [Danaus chrysippus]|uniref:(African queen) hypothetical protein n=1 Tax=Danaus chrysippus TaxID=151541 RepID=A0A8J2QT41_9NEOP|nr:unnamed protein product [Danaus chrysippus]
MKQIVDNEGVARGRGAGGTAGVRGGTAGPARGEGRGLQLYYGTLVVKFTVLHNQDTSEGNEAGNNGNAREFLLRTEPACTHSCALWIIIPICGIGNGQPNLDRSVCATSEGRVYVEGSADGVLHHSNGFHMISKQKYEIMVTIHAAQYRYETPRSPLASRQLITVAILPPELTHAP